MSITETSDEFITRLSQQGKTYTTSEAVEVMKIVDSLPTGNLQLNWVNSKTKKSVIIGYNN